MLAFTLHKLFLLSLPTRGRVGIKLGDADTSPTIYNLLSIHAVFYHSWMFYNHFIATLYHFLGLTY